MAEITEVVLLTSKGPITEENVIGYVNESVYVTAAHLFDRYFISNIDGAELFSMPSVDFTYALKLNSYPYNSTNIIDITRLTDYTEDQAHPLYKANISNPIYSDDLYVDQYKKIIKNVSEMHSAKSEDAFVEYIARQMLKLSKIGFCNLLPTYKKIFGNSFKGNGKCTIERFINYPITIMEQEGIDKSDDIACGVMMSSLKLLSFYFKFYVKENNEEEKGA